MNKISKKQIVIVSIILLLTLTVVGVFLIKSNDDDKVIVEPNPIVSETPEGIEPTEDIEDLSPSADTTAKPTNSPDTTNKPTIVPTGTPKPTVVPTSTPKPTLVPTSTPKPTVVPTPVPTINPTPLPPTATPKPVLCAADGANPDLPCDVLVGNYEGMTMFPGDDAAMNACYAWGDAMNNDPNSTHISYFCTQAFRNDHSIWGSAGILRY